MGSFSLLHWIIVLAVVLLLFGPRRLPDLAKGIGEAIREFKKAVNNPDQAASSTQIAQNQQQQLPRSVDTSVRQEPVKTSDHQG